VHRFGIRTVLDVGCGQGHAVAFLNQIGVHAHGIDGLRNPKSLFHAGRLGALC
jgi:2-polyprenyl-3-methyl-5-hydroxy-6-metoxy-1,4-benzoquinol methylase